MLAIMHVEQQDCAQWDDQALGEFEQLLIVIPIDCNRSRLFHQAPAFDTSD
jgi:hypothetical protein